jgi:tetratricopeptide (TPR) repeat protein
VARQNGDPRGEGLAFNNIGLARLYQSDYPGALAGFQRSLELADQQHDDDAASIRLGNLGNVYFYQGKYLDALRVYEEALRRAEIGGAAVSNGRQLALANLAILYEQLGQNEKALGYYQRAQASASALKPDEYAQLLSNLGTLYRRMGDPVKALDTYERARQVFARGKHPDGEIHVLHNIGIVLALDYKAPARALGAFTLALRLAESTADRRQAVLGRLFRGEALYRLERFEASRAEFDAALAGARQIGAGC